MRTARCGHPATSQRGPLGYCSACRTIGECRMRLRQAVRSARKRDDLTLVTKLVRAIARDPVAYQLDLERQEAATRAAREAAAAAAEAARRPAPTRPTPTVTRAPEVGSGEEWIDKAFGPGRGLVDLERGPW